ncbi:MAG: metal-dependent hydrolase [Aquabacterium sp.]|nr:metal-dependent hydrolase [Aquabacterium sp.]
MNKPPAIVPREKLDFDLDGDIPKYWFDNDPFKTRFFDAMSTIFPEGERFFISCVRDYRDKVTDPHLQQEIKDFIRQEGQHGIVHTQYNNRLKAQGIDVDALERILTHFLFNIERRYLPKAQTLAETAAAEHMTAIMAHAFCERTDVLRKADHRMRAMYTWHAMEEVEHKAVAFDVMQKIAKVGYFRRVTSLLAVTLGFNINALLFARYMLVVDGFSRWQRTKMTVKGLWWLFKPGGLYLPLASHYLSYFKPGFHPWQSGQMRSYALWTDTFNRTGNPILAGEAVFAAGT